MASLDNGMSMYGIEAFWQMIVKGSILLLARLDRCGLRCERTLIQPDSGLGPKSC